MRPTIGATVPTIDTSGKYTQALVDINAMALLIQKGDGLAGGTSPAFDGAIQAYQQAGQLGATTIGPEIDAAGAPNVTQPFTQPAWATNAALAGIVASSSSTQGDASSARDLANAMLDYYQQAVQAGSAAQASGDDAGASPGNKSALPVVACLSLAGGLAWLAWRLHHHG